MKKAETTTAPTFNLDKDTIIIEFIGELLIYGSLNIDQLVDGYKETGLTMNFIDKIFHEILSDGYIELFPDFKPKEFRFSDMKEGEWL